MIIIIVVKFEQRILYTSYALNFDQRRVDIIRSIKKTYLCMKNICLSQISYLLECKPFPINCTLTYIKVILCILFLTIFSSLLNRAFFLHLDKENMSGNSVHIHYTT